MKNLIYSIFRRKITKYITVLLLLFRLIVEILLYTTGEGCQEEIINYLNTFVFRVCCMQRCSPGER